MNNEELNYSVTDASFKALQFINKIDDINHIKQLFIAMITIPIIQPNSTFEQSMNAVKTHAKNSDWMI
jgi:hypothetical protein